MSSRPPPSPPLFPYTTLFRSPAPAIVGFCICTPKYTSSRRLAATYHHDCAASRRTVAPSRHRRTTSNSRNGADRKSTRLNSSHLVISYAVFCLKKKKGSHEQP